MKSQRTSLRQLLVPLLSVFLMLAGMGIPVSAEESNPPETELPNEPIPEEIPEEKKEESGSAVTEEPPEKEDGEGIAEEKEDNASSEETEKTEETAETEEKTPEDVREEGSEAPGEEEESEALGGNETAVRTILLYLCGTDLETNLAAATQNIMQILNADFSEDHKIRFVAMTGGTKEWHMDSSYLVNEDGSPVNSISEEDNQIWELFGADEEDERFRSKMVLLSNQSGFSETDLMTNYQNLINFIDYGYTNYPAVKYDLIMWDHGSGVAGSFGYDDRRKEQYDKDRELTADFILYALKNNKLTKNGEQFEILNFDACLMGSLEMLMAFSPYMRYFVGSALPIPSYGEEYTGWLNVLGENPDMDSYTLGKRIVDAFADSYSEGSDHPGRTVLSVIDVQKFLDSEFIRTFLNMESVLMEEAVTPRDPDGTIRFYDELNSAESVLSYNGQSYVDIGQLAAALGIAMKEVTVNDITPEEEISDRNIYTDVVYPFWNLLADQNMIYTRSTGGLASDYLFYRDGNRDVYFDRLNSTGLSVFFPVVGSVANTVNYLKIVRETLAMMPDDSVRDALKEHFRNTARYALILSGGYAVSMLDDYGRSAGIIAPDAKITLENVISWWKSDPDEGEDSYWEEYCRFLFENAEDSEEEVKAWLSNVVNQQCDETVKPENVSSTAIITPEGTAHQIKIENTKKRALTSIQTKMTAELPVLSEYIETHPEVKKLAELGADFMISVGEINAEPEDPPAGKGEEYLKEYIRWLNDSTSIWNSPAEPRSWYAVKDAENQVHMAMVYDTDTGFKSPALIRVGSTDTLASVDLLFDQNKVLTGFSYNGENNDYVVVNAKDLLRDVEVQMVNRVTLNNSKNVDLPVSEKTFMLNASNYSNISTDMYALDDIPDIHDDMGGEYKTDYRVTVKNIYGYEMEITEEVIDNPTDVLTDIRCTEISYSVFSGREETPTLQYLDNILTEGKDYDLFKHSDHMIDVGNYDITVYGKGDYTGVADTQFEIKPASITACVGDAIEDQVYTGSAITPDVILELISDEGTEEEFTYRLAADTDYTMSFQKNINVGTAEISCTGTGNFTDIGTLTFRIVPCSIKSDTVTVQAMKDQAYTGIPIEEKPVVLFNGNPLTEGTDYTLSWNDNTDAGKAEVTITGIGNFSGIRNEPFNITPLAIDSDSVTASEISDQDYTGSHVCPAPVLAFGGNALKEGVDYTLSYKNNTFPGNAEVTVSGIGNFKGNRRIPFVISPCPADSDLVTIPPIAEQTYTGKPLQPKPRILLNGRVLKEGEDYTLSYRDNINVGTGTITILGRGTTLSGSRDITFRIVKKSPGHRSDSGSGENSPFIPLPQIFNADSGQKVPNTRDNTRIGFWACLHILSLTGIISSCMVLRNISHKCS